MGLVLAVLGLALGCLLVLVGNPVQVMPRYMHPIRHIVVARRYQRLRAEYRIRRPFLQITLVAAGLILFWFFVAILTPIPEDLWLSRVVLGIGVGGGLGWALFCRHELLLGKIGIVGFYPHARMVVAWNNLAGYLLFTDSPGAFILVNKSGDWVEAIPFHSEEEQREIELALLPYLSRLDPADWPLTKVPRHITRALQYRYLLLLMATLPLLTLLVGRFLFLITIPDLYLVGAIGLAILVPVYVFNWARRLRLLYYSSQGHVSVAQLFSLCQRCFYQAVCWQSGLHRRVSWGRDGRARVPTWEEFCKDFRHQPKITREIYQTCCRCLIGHLQAKDLYQVVLIPINTKKEQ
ncbi:MAG: hypothetical protein GX033_02855 [Firmicutes bacterium]|nr:hypothetical protein [Bacillota bacterium]